MQRGFAPQTTHFIILSFINICMCTFSMKVIFGKIIFSMHLMMEFALPLQSEVRRNKQSGNKTILVVAVHILGLSSNRLVLKSF